MNTDTAMRLVNEIVYFPDWMISAEDHTNRFEGTIKVRIDYPARSTDRAEAPNGYPTEIMTYATFPIIVADINDETDLYRRVIDAILRIDAHEAREAFRVRPTYWAPFHPHRVDGMKRWGWIESDLQFGVA